MINQIGLTEAFKNLTSKENSFLIDVRTIEEWQQVGIVDDSSLKNKSNLISWKKLPDMKINDNFLKEVEDFLDKASKDKSLKNLSIFLICRGGSRSNQAAEYLESCGYNSLYNIADGFEGSNHNGWKYSLPNCGFSQ